MLAPRASHLFLFINLVHQVAVLAGSGADIISEGTKKHLRGNKPNDESHSSIKVQSFRSWTSSARQKRQIPDEPPQFATRQEHVPSPVPGASFMSLDGLTLVVVFDKPLNLSASIELVERRQASIDSNETRHRPVRLKPEVSSAPTSQASSSLSRFARSISSRPQNGDQEQSQCQDLRTAQTSLAETPHAVEGVHLCALLLTKKTLRLLHKYQVYRCMWASRVQFIVQLARPVSGSVVRISFQRKTLSEFGAEIEEAGNAQELTVELSRLPLEGLGVPLSPKLALTGPNQVPECGRFTLSAHLASPYGTRLDESIKIAWSVERLGSIVSPNSVASNASALAPSSTSGQASQEANEARWQALKQVVSNCRSNNLLLDAQLLQLAPQLYEFRVQVTFSTSLNIVVLNATHQVTRLDIETPIGSVFGSNMLNQEGGLVNPSQDTLLLADIQVPECTNNVKQVGLYWQVSDNRVRSEQTYSPFYLVRANSLPENSRVEFRLNLFYGIRVKKFASTGIVIPTGESPLDALISDGLLVRSVGLGDRVSDNLDSPADNRQVELYAGKANDLYESTEKYNYQWSCFDGKTAQPCARSSAANPTVGSIPGSNSNSNGNASSSEPLVEKLKARLPVLRIPIGWFRPDAQLWFGLQRYDRQNPSQQSKTEYALVGIQQGAGPTEVSVGPVLLGNSRHRAHMRNPLTGAVLLPANAPAVVVGRLGPRHLISSFVWHSANMIQPLYWTTRNVTNPFNGQQEYLTELHLNAAQQVAHSHHQFQLVACTHSGVKAAATVSLDVVQGISECFVEIDQNQNLGTLSVSVNYCNIPIGLSPITYQLYFVDTTSHADNGLVEEEDPNNGNNSNGPLAGNNATSRAVPSADDHLFKASYFDGHAQPLTAPQLTPVFAQLSPIYAMLIAKYEQLGSIARIRFGVRACDRLQVCRMFYSTEFNPKLLNPMQSSQSQNQTAIPNNSRLTQDSTSAVAKIQSMQSVMEGARRANLAGNSIAAISLLNGVVGLGQTRATQSKLAGLNHLDEDGVSQQQGQATSDLDRLLQVAIRDCLAYGIQSIRRQFHYTDSGQTNMVLHTLARIMSLKQVSSGIDSKFKVLKLLTLLSRKTIGDWLNMRLNALADFSAIQAAFESLFGTFNHYSIESITDPNTQRPTLSKSSETGTKADTQDQRLDRLASQPQSKSHKNSSSHHSESPLSKKNRRQEATLAYLKSVRQAFRSLISVAAIQLPLGATEQFRYASDPLLELDNLTDSKTNQPFGMPSTSTVSLAESNSNAGGPKQDGASASHLLKNRLSRDRVADIVSSMTHLTELATDTIDVDLRELGSISMKFDEKFVTNIRSKLTNGALSCRNETSPGQGDRQTSGTQSMEDKCSSLVLSLTSFGGKGPFRSLDNTNELDRRMLRVPILEVDILSPMDGSSIASRDLISSANEPNMNAITSVAAVTFTIPNIEQQDLVRGTDNWNQQKNLYRCYQFDESLNEWIEVTQTLPNDAVDQRVDDERRISCTFNRVGVFAAFQGRPPSGSAFSVIRLIWLTGSIVVGLVAIFTVLGCIAAGKKGETQNDKSNRRNSGNNSTSGSDLKKSDASRGTGYISNGEVRHPEEVTTSYRNDFNNYPRMGR